MFAIEVIDISKTYRLYNKPSDRLKEVIFRKQLHTSFASLSNISFSVPFGESLGIIGDNGAGKSTILKIVAGTISPTSGNLASKGRVAALLELGAGFHYEFTGRQNIWMNASLMGLDKTEIQAKLQDIIDFSELGAFIDRPIKTYSSGMVIRLAFSIATSVDPDILIIDEALSVGDHYFQKKCIDRMIEFKKEKKTILFCSHGMFMVNQLCDRAIWLDNGQVREIGVATHITANYENYSRARSVNKESAGKKSAEKNITKRNSDKIDSDGQEIKNKNSKNSYNLSASSGVQDNKSSTNRIPVMVTSVCLNNTKDGVDLYQGDDLSVEIQYEGDKNTRFFIAIGIHRNDGLLCHATNMSKNIKEPLCGKTQGKVVLQYKKLPFLHGKFSVVALIMDESGLQCFHKKESAEFAVLPKDTWDNEMGLLKLEHKWYL